MHPERDMAMWLIFWGFCRNWFLIDPLHYLSSRSDFGFEFAEIFVFEKRLPDSASRGVGESGSRRLPASPSWRVGFWMFKRKLGKSESRRQSNSASRGVDECPTRRVGELTNIRLGESGSRRISDSGSRGVVFPLQISPQIRSPNQNGWKRSVMDLCRTGLCKNPRKSASLPCPFNA
jgi:hypothetical protein